MSPQEYTKQHALEVPIEVETRTLQEVLEVKELIQEHSGLRIDRVMLDNMTTLDSSHEGAHAAPACGASAKVVPDAVQCSALSAGPATQ